MDYLPHTSSEWDAMVRRTGSESVDQLIKKIVPSEIPRSNYRLERGMSELELMDLMKSKASQNADPDTLDVFIGAGAYHHYIPSVVAALSSRPEFATAYTPYQPEASQGTLQALFEYQTMIARLTGMDVSNASLYDGASALAEGALMAAAVARNRGKILIAQTVHPQYRAVVKTYLKAGAHPVVEIPHSGGCTDMDALRGALKGGAIAVLVQWPNFFGCLEDLEALAGCAHEHGALLVVAAYPIALGLFKGPGHFGADICVGDGQSLGNPLQYGGPYFGFIACRKEYVRKMPGRIVGMTRDLEGKRGFVLTLQAREQHIRREKATSNICTNHSLNALASAVYMAVMGHEGLRRLAEINFKKAHYAARLLGELPGFSLAFAAPFFNEFVLRVPARPADMVERLQTMGILPGLTLQTDYPDLDDALLICVTEMISRSKIEHLADVMKDCVQGALRHGKDPL